MELETAGGGGVAAERLTPDLEPEFLRSLSFPNKDFASLSFFIQAYKSVQAIHTARGNPAVN